jgi:hypothetical protein
VAVLMKRMSPQCATFDDKWGYRKFWGIRVLRDVLEIKGQPPTIRWFQNSILLYLGFFPPLFNLLGKEIEAQRTGRLIKVDILAIKLIALHKQLGL